MTCSVAPCSGLRMASRTHASFRAQSFVAVGRDVDRVPRHATASSGSSDRFGVSYVAVECDSYHNNAADMTFVP